MRARITVNYVRGPLDGVVEDLTVTMANTPMLVGPDSCTAPEGWYTKADATGKRTWIEGPPAWWKPKVQ